MNPFNQDPDYDVFLIPENIVGNPRTSPETEEAIITRTRVEASTWLQRCRAVITRLWQRSTHWTAADLYRRDEREFPAQHPLKPSSLSSRLIADIWMLKSKL